MSPKKDSTKAAKKVAAGSDDSFSYKLKLLEKELDFINSLIARIDSITQATKNWSVIIWAGSLAIFFANPILQNHIYLTALPPFLFWYIDAHWRHLQKRSIFRQIKISEYLNSDNFLNDYSSRNLTLKILDVAGYQYRKLPEYEKAISTKRTLLYKEISYFYSGQILISIMAFTFFLIL